MRFRLLCLCTVGMIDLFLEICGSAAFAQAHGPRNDRRLFEMSLSICTQGQALVRSRKKNPVFVFHWRFSNHESLCHLTFVVVGFFMLSSFFQLTIVRLNRNGSFSCPKCRTCFNWHVSKCLQITLFAVEISNFSSKHARVSNMYGS